MYILYAYICTISFVVVFRIKKLIMTWKDYPVKLDKDLVKQKPSNTHARAHTHTHTRTHTHAHTTTDTISWIGNDSINYT